MSAGDALGPGHVVGLAGGSPAWQARVHARARQDGWVLVPVHGRSPAQEQARQLRHAGAHACLAGDLAAAGPARLAGLPVATGLDGPWLDGGRPADPPGATDARFILHTSGTTGAPRAVTITEGMLATHAAAVARRMPLRDATWLCVLPLYHVGGVALVDRALRGTLGASGEAGLGHVRFAARPDGTALRDVTHVSLVPTHLHRLVEAGGSPSSLRVALVGGDAAPVALLRSALAAGWPVWPTYGLTEATSQVATASPEEWANHPGTVGRPLEGVRVQAGTSGPADIIVSGPTVAGGGPVPTGDVGELIEGRLFVRGRRADQIVTGGENVDAAAVEHVLRGHPAVADCAVVGLPDPQWGQRVAALLVLRAGGVDEVDAWCRPRLGGHERPRTWRAVDALPRTPEGKLRRAGLAAMFGA